MPPERFQQIEELYHAVRERTAEERCVRLPEPKLSRTPLNQDVGDSRYISDDQVQSPNEAIP